MKWIFSISFGEEGECKKALQAAAIPDVQELNIPPPPQHPAIQVQPDRVQDALGILAYMSTKETFRRPR